MTFIGNLLNILFIFSISKYHLSAAATNYGPCNTPNRQQGSCIALQSCKVLNDMLSQPAQLTTEDRTFLSRSQCGYVSGQVLVCCPNSTPGRTRIAASILPTPPTCGITPLNNKIFGGNRTEIDEYPWSALIEYTSRSGVKSLNCGGALISDRYVLTAAHCHLRIPSDMRLTGVRLGEWDTGSSPDCIVDSRGRRDCAPNHIDIPVEEVITHPDYIPRSKAQENDIALIRLSRSVEFNDYVRPVCLPPRTRSTNFEDVGMDVSGWGKTESGESSRYKLKATVAGWKLNDCKQKYSPHGIALQETQLCAGGVAGVDSCKGDSGGPLVIDEKEDNSHINYLIGVVSFGPSPCAMPGWPGVYTVVSKYIDWIESTVH